MRYEDYKIEDQVFINKVDWTDEEKIEFLNTCPESKDTQEKLEVLRKVITDIEDGILKCNKYGDVHAKSAESYAKKNNKFLYYASNRYSGSKYLKILIDGVERELRSLYAINRVIEAVGNVNDRFENVARIYKEKEIKWKKNHDESLYEEENRERIIANRIAIQWLKNIRLDIPSEIKEDDILFRTKNIPMYVAEGKRFSGYDYVYTNRYGELEFNGQVVTKEDAEYISKVIERATWDFLPVMNKVKATIEDVREKYKSNE